MKFGLGLVFAAAAVAGFALAYYQAIRPGAGWLDSQWLFVAALPYDWTSLRLTGEANFSPDAASQVAAAATFDVALAFVIGFVLETGARALWRGLSRVRGRA